METNAYLEDIYPRNLLYAVTIRSPVAKGSIKLIQFPKLPENYSIITARNIPGENRFEDASMPVLADRYLSYIGEPVAIILGPDKVKLEEISLLCNIIVDEEKPVFSCENTDINSKENESVREIQIGNIHEAFGKKGRIVTGSYSTGIQAHWYSEPSGAVTSYNHKVLTVKTATQWPYHVKRSIARVLGIDESSVCVEATPINIHMDGKLWFPSLIACHAALGTYFTKKPVRLILNKEEDFLYSPKRCASNIDIMSIVDDNGNIKATDIEITVNLGAYAVNSNEILDQICLGCISYYNFDNLKLSASAKKTNIPPQGPFSGFGLSQGFFAIERHVSQIADTFDLEPAQWRKNHLISGKNQITAGELMDLTVKSSDYYRKWASYELLRQSSKGKTAEKKENPRGIGIAIGLQGNGLLYDNKVYSVEVTLTKENILEIKTSINSSENYNKIWEKIAIETISIEPDKIRIITDDSPDCGPCCASRNITAITKLVDKCCQTIRKQQHSHSPLPITVRRSIKPQNGELLNGCFAPAAGKVMDANAFSKPGQACAVVEVSIDNVECIPKIRGVWLGVAGGKVISHNRAKRSLTRGTIQALGWAFTEFFEYREGKLPKDQYENFSILSPADIPPIHIDFLPDNSNDTRGIGELPFTCIPAALLQAASQAMDFSFKSVPLKRKDIWEMIRLRNMGTLAGVK